MYLVLCYDRRPGYGWFAYSGALKTKMEALEVIKRAPKEGMTGKPIKYSVIDFWMPIDKA